MSRRTISLLILSLAVASFAGVGAQTVPSGFVVDTLVNTGLNTPNDIDWTPDGRILIVERSGGIRVWTGTGAAAIVGTVAGVVTGSERGLLSIAVDPGFATNGYIYVWFARNSGNMTLARYTLTGDLTNPNSTNLNLTAQRRIINAPDNAFNHNGGSVRFGPDGMLYLSIGDDANACSAQSTNSYSGSLVRMDVSGLPAGGSTSTPSAATLDPGDNPNSGLGGLIRLLIAIGLRNPWKMEIDQVTGNAYIGDVGQNAREECSEYVVPTAGNFVMQNFGWPWREGNGVFSGCGGSTPAGLIPPIVDIAQSQGWFSGMSGPRYRNQGSAFDFGPSFEGDYFYGDYFAGQIRRLENTGGAWNTTPGNWGTGFGAMSCCRQGPDGAIYVTRHNGTYSTSGGSLQRIRPDVGTNNVAVISGGGQYQRAGEMFADPIVFEVRDPMGNAIPAGTINVAVSGPGSISGTSFVADQNGQASVMVSANNQAGTLSPINVTATTPGGSSAGSTATVYRRNLHIIFSSAPATTDLLIVQVGNFSPNSSVPYSLMIAPDGTPTMNTFIGPVCTDPLGSGFVFADAIGIFGGAQPQGSTVGNPTLSRVYSFPNNALSGLTLIFQVLGYDAGNGGFLLTDCETISF